MPEEPRKCNADMLTNLKTTFENKDCIVNSNVVATKLGVESDFGERQSRIKVCSVKTKLSTRLINLKCMYTNAKSSMNKNKREEVEIRLTLEEIDILEITQSWEHCEISDGEINFRG